jgi:hypothetical protein
MPAIMHRTEPPASSMVDTSTGSSSAEREMTSRCALVSVPSARLESASSRPCEPCSSIALPAD